jgi:aspartate racemase
MAKTIGILGGLTPESTVLYYQHIIHQYYTRYENYNYPEIIIYSVSLQRFNAWMNSEDWPSIETALVSALNHLYAAGADFAVIASNTMHMLFDRVQEQAPLPVISIIEATTAAIQRDEVDCVGLLGTRFTMERAFYRDTLQRYGIQSLIPPDHERPFLDTIIFDELSRGIITPSSRSTYLNSIDHLAQRGAQGIILGCTEIPLLITPQDTSIPLYDTAKLHAEHALNTAVT